MTPKALVVDDDPAIIDAVGETLESLGHVYDHAGCVESARKLMDQDQYSYFLVDLEIPLRAGRTVPRIQNGENLLEEIIRRTGTRKRPVIVMTAHGKDGPDLAVEVMKKGAVDYVTKPFPVKGYTLDKKINEALTRVGATPHGAAGGKSPGAGPSGELTPFGGGELVFYRNRVELCGVRVCGGARSGQTRRILDRLRAKRPNGKYVACSGVELADAIDCETGQNGVAGTIRDFRRHVAETLADQSGLKCGARDVILSGGVGYRLHEWIVVKDGADERFGAAARPAAANPDGESANVPATGDDDPAKARRAWILGELTKGRELRTPTIVHEQRCSTATAKRDLEALKSDGRIEFVGPAKTGHYRLKR